MNKKVKQGSKRKRKRKTKNLLKNKKNWRKLKGEKGKKV